MEKGGSLIMKVKKRKMPFGMAVSLLLLSLFLIMVCAACTGSADIPVSDAVKLLIARVPGIGRLCDLSKIRPAHQLIVYQVRLPRIFLSGLVGMGLAVTGAAFQGLFRNPLADPHILGVSSGAALGATLAMLSGVHLRFFGMGAIGLFAFAGGLVTVLVVYRVACTGAMVKSMHLLLTGTAASSLLSSVISLLMTRNREELEKIYLWTLGSFSAASWDKVGFLLAFLVLGSGLLLAMGRELNLLAAGEDTARTLGVSIRTARWIIILAGTFLVAACVSASGIIGFVGLIIPHCVRLVSGADHSRLLPYSMLAGAIFMIFCDTLARVVTAPSEIPVGVVTAIFGAPYFIYLMYRDKRERTGRV